MYQYISIFTSNTNSIWSTSIPSMKFNSQLIILWPVAHWPIETEFLYLIFLYYFQIHVLRRSALFVPTKIRMNNSKYFRDSANLADFFMRAKSKMKHSSCPLPAAGILDWIVCLWWPLGIWNPKRSLFGRLYCSKRAENRQNCHKKRTRHLGWTSLPTERRLYFSDLIKMQSWIILFD